MKDLADKKMAMFNETSKTVKLDWCCSRMP